MILIIKQIANSDLVTWSFVMFYCLVVVVINPPIHGLLL